MLISNPSVPIVEDHAVVAAHQTALMEEAGFTVLASVVDAEAAFIGKPFRDEEIINAVRGVLRRA